MRTLQEVRQSLLPSLIIPYIYPVTGGMYLCLLSLIYLSLIIPCAILLAMDAFSDIPMPNPNSLPISRSTLPVLSTLVLRLQTPLAGIHP